MVWPFKRRLKNFLGIDIGTSFIKIVELSKHGEQERLENYGFVSIPSGEPFRKGKILFSSKEVAEILKAILKEAKIKTFQAFFSLPDFVTFFTSFALPPMSEKEVPQAVRFEARRHVPLSLKEVTLDWNIIKGVTDKRKGELEVLLCVVLNETINQYKRIVELSNLELLALEAEVFGLQRSLAKQKNTLALIDIGARSTTCSIIDEKILKVSYSFDLAGDVFTERISKSLNLDYQEAEGLKKEKGLLEEELRKALIPTIDLLLLEIKKVSENFYQREGKEVKTYVLAGGSALLPGLKEYFAKDFEKEVKIADPFFGMIYPPILEETLKNLGPQFSIAVGMALKGLE